MLWRMAHRRGGGREGDATRTLCRGRSGGRAEGSRTKGGGGGGGGCRAAQRGAGALVAHTKASTPNTHAHTQACRGGGWTPLPLWRGVAAMVGWAARGEGNPFALLPKGGHPRSKGRGTVRRQPSGRWNRQRADECHTHTPHERGGGRPPHEAARDQRGRPSREARWYDHSRPPLPFPHVVGGRGVNVPGRRGGHSGGVAWKTGLAASTGQGGGGGGQATSGWGAHTYHARGERRREQERWRIGQRDSAFARWCGGVGGGKGAIPSHLQ